MFSFSPVSYRMPSHSSSTRDRLTNKENPSRHYKETQRMQRTSTITREESGCSEQRRDLNRISFLLLRAMWTSLWDIWGAFVSILFCSSQRHGYREDIPDPITSTAAESGKKRGIGLAAFYWRATLVTSQERNISAGRSIRLRANVVSCTDPQSCFCLHPSHAKAVNMCENDPICQIGSFSWSPGTSITWGWRTVSSFGAVCWAIGG